MNGNDPHDDVGNKALDYAADNVEKVLAAMDLAELCAEFDIGLAEGLSVFSAYYEWRGLYSFCEQVYIGARNKGRYVFTDSLRDIQDEGLIDELFDEMLCVAIRANEGYQQRMSEKLQERHRAGEVDDWHAQDNAEERAREREDNDA